MVSLPTARDLKAERIRLGLTQASLAEAAGISQSMVARVERGTVDPRYSTVRAIVDALQQAERGEVLVADIMTSPVAEVGPAETVGGAVRVMRGGGFSQIPVVDGGSQVGSLREDDVIHLLGPDRPDHLAERAVRDVMGPPLPSVGPRRSAREAMAMLEDAPALVVMDRGSVVGIVTKSDLLATLDARDPATN